MRKPISKKLRFDVFKRDNFICQYCGRQPPSAVLEVDHIVPVSDGGTNNIDNLIAACFDCNRGKGATSLETTPDSVARRAEIAKERKQQLDEFIKLQRQMKKREDTDIDTLEDIFSRYFPKKVFTETFREASMRKFLRNIDIITLEGHMHTACNKKNSDPSAALSYFCGICWNIIKGGRRGY